MRAVGRVASNATRENETLFFSVRIQLTKALMSPSATHELGGIGTGPQTPTPPALTFCVNLANAPASPLYFAATS